jgi:hypothetical protein
MSDPSVDPVVASIHCPQCHDEASVPLRVTAVSARRAARQPIPPQMIRVCPTCRALLVVSLAPAPEGSAS